MLDATEEGFRDWIVSRRPELRRTAFLLCGDWFLADDLVQDAAARVYARWPRIAGLESPDAYLRKTLVNLYLDHTRRPARREELVAELPDRAAPAAGDGIDHRDQLLAALRDVPAGQRAVLVLRFWEDLSVEQAAAALGTSTGNVKSQTARGLETLRAACALRGLASPSDLAGEPR